MTNRGPNPMVDAGIMEIPGYEPSPERALDQFRRDNTRPGALFFTGNVSNRLGALIAIPLVSGRVTPNELTLVGVGMHLAAAIYLVFLPPHSWLLCGILAAFLQLAFAVDCADGQLARARGRANAFGGWLDQLADFVSHSAILSAFITVVVRAEPTRPAMFMAMFAIAVCGNLFQLFATSQRNTMLGLEPGVGRGWQVARWLLPVRHFSDYGALLLSCSLLVRWPFGLGVVLIGSGALAIATCCGQVWINWPRASNH